MEPIARSLSRPVVLLLALACAACPSSGGRAALTWSRSFGGPNGEEAATALATSDGGYLLVGTRNAVYETREVLETAQIDGELWLVKLDGAGNPSWERTYGEALLSPAGNRVRYGRAAPAEGGGYWLGGDESASPTPAGDPAVDGGNVVVARLDGAGDVAWQRTYDSGAFLGRPFASPVDSAHESIRAIAPVPGGGVLVGAWISARVHDPKAGRIDVEVNGLWITRLDDDGDELWALHLVGEEDGVVHDRFFPYRAGATVHVVLAPDGEGGALVTACSSAYPDTRIARVQADGSLLWSATRIDGHVRAAAAIDADADGRRDDGFALAGVDEPLGNERGFLTRLDALGNPLWSIDDDEVGGFDCIAQGEFIHSGGLQVSGVAAAGTRLEGSSRVGKLHLVSLDGAHEGALELSFELTQRLRFDIDRWEILGVTSDEAAVAAFARDLDPLGSRALARVPDADTVEILADGSVLDVDRRAISWLAWETVLARQGPDGTLALERAFPDEGRFVERAHAAVELAGGGYAVLGESTSFADGFERVWLLLLDADGEIVRQRLFPTASLGWYDPTERLQALVATADGGLAFAAWIEDHLRVVRLDAAGNELWNSAPLSPEDRSGWSSGEGLAALIELADGGFAAAGPTDASGSWAARLAGTGAVLWRRTFSPANGRAQEATTIVETPSGLALAGVHDGEPWLLDLDASGAVLGSSFYPLGGTAAGPSCRLATDVDGGLLLATSWLDVEEPSGSVEDGGESTGRVNVLLLALDGDREPRWYRVYGALFDEVLSDLRPVPEGGWVVAGRSDSLGERSEAWLLRVDFEGLIDASCNAYLAGGEWPGVHVPVTMVVADYAPPGDLGPAELATFDTTILPQRPPSAVVARQCAGFTPPAGAPDGGGGGGETFTLFLEFEGEGEGRVVSDPAGIDCRATCSASFPAGTRVTLTPSVEQGFFSHWDGADEDHGIDGCVVIMDSDRTVTVYFE